MMANTNTAAGAISATSKIIVSLSLLLLLQALVICLLPPPLLGPHLRVPTAGVLSIGVIVLHTLPTAPAYHTHPRVSYVRAPL